MRLRMSTKLFSVICACASEDTSANSITLISKQAEIYVIFFTTTKNVEMGQNKYVVRCTYVKRGS